MTKPELVVLLNEANMPIGSALKKDVHTHNTPLHLAFSCYLVNEQNEVLLTRRALSKQTWPGVWTNSFCGHPAPQEASADAVRRRADYELGTTIEEPDCVLPDFGYVAVDASGIVENEHCPVYVSSATTEIAPNPEEVSEYVWVSIQDLQRAVASTPFAFSPWLVEQLPGVANHIVARVETGSQ